MQSWLDEKKASLIKSYKLVSPASTLLVATAVALVIGLVSQYAVAQTPAQTFGHVWVSDTVPPGGTIQVAVNGRSHERYTAYLPGLSDTRFDLRYDQKTGFHTAELRVPTAAPTQGYCTVRLINKALLEEDHKVVLTIQTQLKDDI